MAKDWTLSYYFIAFIDVLGQSKELLKLERLPKTQEEIENASKILHNTAGSITRLRNGFRTYYRTLEKPPGILDPLPPEIRAKAEEVRRNETIITTISDSIIISIPISNEYNHCVSIQNIYKALYGICGIYLAALAEKKPFRSGIDIGLGVPLKKNEVYGGALIKAYKLENNNAIYPRIVVGNSLYDYLNTISNQSLDNQYARFAKRWANESMKFFINDYDSLKILDVMGEGAKSISGGIDNNIVERAYEFVVQSHNEYANSNNTKLYARYGYLRNYFESKLDLWNIEPIK